MSVVDDSKRHPKIASVSWKRWISRYRAEDGEKALELQAQPADAVCSTGNAGHGRLRVSRQSAPPARRRRGQVVFCTTENGIDHIARAINAGATIYIMKPSHKDDRRGQVPRSWFDSGAGEPVSSAVLYQVALGRDMSGTICRGDLRHVRSGECSHGGLVRQPAIPRTRPDDLHSRYAAVIRRYQFEILPIQSERQPVNPPDYEYCAASQGQLRLDLSADKQYLIESRCSAFAEGGLPGSANSCRR